jgi:hypothetical protein
MDLWFNTFVCKIKGKWPNTFYNDTLSNLSIFLLVHTYPYRKGRARVRSLLQLDSTVVSCPFPTSKGDAAPAGGKIKAEGIEGEAGRV